MQTPTSFPCARHKIQNRAWRRDNSYVGLWDSSFIQLGSPVEIQPTQLIYSYSWEEGGGGFQSFFLSVIYASPNMVTSHSLWQQLLNLKSSFRRPDMSWLAIADFNNILAPPIISSATFPVWILTMLPLFSLKPIPVPQAITNSDLRIFGLLNLGSET